MSLSRPVRDLVLVWIGLMALLALTVAATFAPLGPLKPVANLGIAFAKAGLIAWTFMHLREQAGLVRLFSVAALVWLVILFALTQADLWTRAWSGG